MRLRCLFFAAVLPWGLSALDFWDAAPADQLARDLSQAMSLQELAAQVLMVAFPEPVPDVGLQNWVAGSSLGGIKFFGWNSGSPESVAAAVALLQEKSQKSRFRIPLLVATDQEGGWVRHIKGTTTTTPGNLALGSSGLPYDAFQTGRLLGGELRQMGVNMNFAPTVDLYLNPDSGVIGPRSFSQDPVQAGVLGSAFAKGLGSQGVLATAKHFPGHGNTPDDSHGRLPVLTETLAQLRARELVPYRMMIAEGLPAVMSGHLAFPNAFGENNPASLSAAFLQGVLREELGFRGLIVTDDLLMDGARPDNLTIAEAAGRALEAGNDLLLISKPVSSQHEAAARLVSLAAEPAFREKLRSAAAVVLKTKLEALKGPRAVPLIPSAKLVFPPPGTGDFVFQTTARSAVLLAGKDLPWKTEGDLLAITPYDGILTALSRHFPRTRELAYEYRFSGFDAATRDQIVSRVASSARSVFVLAVPGGLAYLKALEPYQDKLAVVSLLSPVLLRDVPWVRNAVAVFGTNQAAFEVAAAVLAGDFTPPGRLPVRFGLFPWGNP